MTWNYAPGIGHDLGLRTECVTTPLPDGGSLSSWATFSPDLIYRYALARIWDDHGTMLVVCGLNPSTADHEVTDPTLRKLLHVAKRDHYGGLILVNVAAFRAADPTELVRGPKFGSEVAGPHNQEVIRRALDMPLLARAVAAWGSPKWAAIRPLIRNAKTTGARRTWDHCLGVTKAGHPRHPLYLRNDTAIRPWTPDEARRAAA